VQDDGLELVEEGLLLVQGSGFRVQGFGLTGGAAAAPFWFCRALAF
jgi:hypothetical protein